MTQEMHDSLKKADVEIRMLSRCIEPVSVDKSGMREALDKIEALHAQSEHLIGIIRHDQIVYLIDRLWFLISELGIRAVNLGIVVDKRVEHE